jgi:hypothetical protein
MQFAATAAFLLVPNKRETLQLLLVLFYFWAGTLKLNWEWLSGAALYRPLWLFTGRGIIVACAYVIVMELVVVWGLLARDRRIFWLCFAQVLVFHVFSWAVVGFFYPLLMFGLLAIFPLCRLIPAPRPGASRGEAILRGRLSRSAALVALVFSAMQLSTHLYPGDTAITGEGRLFALHMFDARVECDARIVLKLKDGRRVDHELADQGIRTRCDPDPRPRRIAASRDGDADGRDLTFTCSRGGDGQRAPAGIDIPTSARRCPLCALPAQ